MRAMLQGAPTTSKRRRLRPDLSANLKRLLYSPTLAHQPTVRTPRPELVLTQQEPLCQTGAVILPSPGRELAREPVALGLAGPVATARVRCMTVACVSENELVGDMVHLNSASLLMGVSVAEYPTRVASLTPLERAVLDGLVPAEDPADRIRKGIVGWAAISEVKKTNPKTISGHVRYWNVYVSVFCDPEGYDPWVICPTMFELFAGHMYELRAGRRIDKFASAINFVHAAHGLAAVVKGGRYMEAKQAYVKAVISRGGLSCTYRALIPDSGYVNFLGRLAGFEWRREWENCDRAFMILAKQLSWVRAVTLGASIPGDFRVFPQGTNSRGQETYVYKFIIRKTKCGNEEFRPTTQTIPWPSPRDDNGIAEVVMGFVARTLLRNPLICAASVGINPTSAAGKITGWMRDFMPLGELGLPAGAMISSHSARDTGATHARRSLYPPCDWDTVMSWGGWQSQKRCIGYIKPLSSRSAFWKDFYYWLAPDYRLDVGFPREGYAETTPS